MDQPSNALLTGACRGLPDRVAPSAPIDSSRRSRKRPVSFKVWPHAAFWGKTEPKTPYNGAEGVPIREEIVAEHDPDVVTRNGYGALCLNTPDALFVDVDDATVRAMPRGSYRWVWAVAGLLALAWTTAWAMTDPHALATCSAASASWLGFALRTVGQMVWRWVLLGVVLSWSASTWRALWVDRRGGALGAAQRTLERRQATHPHESWRLYRTPAGARALAMHDVFDPRSDATQTLMVELGTDPMYALMCRRQGCFRARVSPKPWRVPGLTRLRGGVWPLDGEALDRRQAWVNGYNALQGDYAACAWVADTGRAAAHPRTEAVRSLHDRLSQALSGKPLA